jgi:predicted dehydrogenase
MNKGKSYNLGIIGAGMIARQHLEHLRKTGRANVTWIAAINPENLENVRQEFKIARKTHDYRDMLKDPDVDMVLIATPPHLHKEMFIEAVKAGKHILLEKPMALNAGEIDEMMKIKRLYPDVIAMECSGRHARLTPKFRKVKEIIDSGVLGEIYRIHHNSVARQGRPGIEFHPTAKWFLNRSKAGGGPLFDWGVYDLSFHMGLLGDTYEVEEIESVILKSDLDEVDPGTDTYDVEEHFVVNMRLNNNVTYYWERGGHANVEVPNETRIYGPRGGVKLAYCTWEDPVITFYDLDKEGKARKQLIELDYSDQDDGYALSEHMLRVLDGEEKPVIPLEIATRHMDILFKCYEVAEKTR